MALCKGCNETKVDPRTYSGKAGWCSETCRILSGFAAERRAASFADLLTVERQRYAVKVRESSVSGVVLGSR